MTGAILIRLMLFAVAMALPIMGVQALTFYLLRTYAARIAASLEQLTQLVSAHERQVVQVSQLIDSAATSLTLVATRLSPPESA